MDEVSVCIARLTDKNAAAACAYATQITEQSRIQGGWYLYFDAFAALLDHKNSLVRNRAIAILAANARWDTEDKLERGLDKLLVHIVDEKPITARQCIRALPEIAAAKPELTVRIREALQCAELSGYQDSMRPLIEKDIAAALQQMGGDCNGS